MLRSIYNKYREIIITHFSNSSKAFSNEWGMKDDGVFDRFSSMIHKDCTFERVIIELEPSEKIFKWVGAQILNKSIFGIPNDENRILKLNQKISYIDLESEGNFKWTGGCVWQDKVYCFPRSACSFLVISENTAIEEPLKIKYIGEHHYAGVCSKEGIVYQPPRNTDHILRTDLRTMKCKKIYIVADKFRIKLRYCGSIIHPNGYIYFFPETNNRVIKLNPITDEWCFIGAKISTMCFDAKIGIDGNIYGFCGDGKGIMKIDVYNDKTTIVHEEIVPYAYGTKYGCDGLLYSIPGKGRWIYRFDIINDTVEKFIDLHDSDEVKYAGGVTTSDGDIYFIPAQTKNIMMLKAKSKYCIADDIYDTFFKDFY